MCVWGGCQSNLCWMYNIERHWKKSSLNTQTSTQCCAVRGEGIGRVCIHTYVVYTCPCSAFSHSFSFLHHFVSSGAASDGGSGRRRSCGDNQQSAGEDGTAFPILL